LHASSSLRSRSTTAAKKLHFNRAQTERANEARNTYRHLLGFNFIHIPFFVWMVAPVLVPT